MCRTPKLNILSVDSLSPKTFSKITSHMKYCWFELACAINIHFPSSQDRVEKYWRNNISSKLFFPFCRRTIGHTAPSISAALIKVYRNNTPSVYWHKTYPSLPLIKCPMATADYLIEEGTSSRRHIFSPSTPPAHQSCGRSGASPKQI